MFKNSLVLILFVGIASCALVNHHHHGDFLSVKEPKKLFVGYFETWSEKRKQDAKDTGLARLPPYVNVVNVAFMLPNNKYSGNLDLKSAGIDLPYDGNEAKTAIALLKAKNPETKVLISVGGASYTGWDKFNEAGVAKLVKDLGLDGVDIDYEPENCNCIQHDGDVSCPTDPQYIDVIQRMRKALPRPYILSIAGWSDGAYGQGDFQNDQPQDEFTGLAGKMLRKTVSALDMIHIMSYDAGTDLDPKRAYWAYKSLFSGKVTIGIEIPPEAWGDHRYTMSQVYDLCDFANDNDGAGLMLWSLQQKPHGAVTANNSNAQLVAQGACWRMGLANCDDPLNV